MKKTYFLSLALPALLANAPAFAAPAAPVELVADANTQTDADAPTYPSVPTRLADKPTTAPEKSTAVNVPADTHYTVHPGDVLQITVWKEDTLDREVLVLPDGTIDFPLIGSFSVQGMTPAKIQATVKEKLRKFIPDAPVTVVVKATLGHSVSVIGQVAKPGEFVMGHRLTVMQALSQAGGLTPYASDSRIIILRRVDGKEISIPFPYDDIITGQDLDKDIVLQPGDVVVVPSASLF